MMPLHLTLFCVVVSVMLCCCSVVIVFSLFCLVCVLFTSPSREPLLTLARVFLASSRQGYTYGGNAKLGLNVTYGMLVVWTYLRNGTVSGSSG